MSMGLKRTSEVSENFSAPGPFVAYDSESTFPKVSLRLRGKVYTWGFAHADFKRGDTKANSMMLILYHACEGWIIMDYLVFQLPIR